MPAGNDRAPIRKAFTRRDFEAKTAEAAEFGGLAAEAWAAWERSCRHIEAAHQRTESVGRQVGDAGPVPVKEFIEKATKRPAGDPRFLEQIFDCIETRQKMLDLGKSTPVKMNQAAINWDDLCILARPETDPLEEAIAQATFLGPSAASGISAAAFSALGMSANGKP